MKRILIVDDDPDIVESLAMILEERYLVASAYDGAQALDRVRSDAFDVIVLDLMMPILDGQGFALEMKKEGIATPIIVVSAGSDLGQRAREIGAVSYVAKPFDLDRLEAMIAAVCS
jgi:DNA-binding response OmpR family regulator